MSRDPGHQAADGQNRPKLKVRGDVKVVSKRNWSGLSFQNKLLLVLSAVLIINFCPVLCLGGGYAIWFVVQSSRRTSRENEQRTESEKNLKQLGQAFQRAQTADGYVRSSLPAKNGLPGLSWRVALLPYLGHESLHREFHLDEPWNSPHNIQLLSKMPAVFMNPRMPPATNETCYQVFVGRRAVFEHGKKTQLLAPSGRAGKDEIEISDGLANTILIAESYSAVPWTKPEDIAFDPSGFPPNLGPPTEKQILVCMADGTVRAIPKTTPRDVISAAITANGREKATLP